MEKTNEAPVQLISVEVVAKILDCHPRQVYRLADSGRFLKPLKLGGSTKWIRSQVEQWILDGCPRVSQGRKR